MPSAKGIRAGRAFVELFADDSKLVRGLRRAERKIKAFGASVRSIGMRMAAVSGAAVAAMLATAKQFSSVGDEVAKMAKRTGVAVETLSELRYAASQTGTEFKTVENAFRKMQRSIYDAGRELSTQVDAFKDLNLTFKDLDGLSPEAQFKKIAEQISKVEDPTKKAAIAMSLFGRTGTNLLPMFAQGAAGIEALQKQARDLGLTISAKDAAAAEDFTDEMDRMWKVVKMGVFHIGAALAPVLSEVARFLTEAAVAVGRWVRENRGMIVSALKLVAGILAVGAALVVAGTVISGFGAVLGVIGTVISTAGMAMALLGSILAAMLTPIGLVAVALVGLAGYLVYATSVGARALKWLGGKFGTLADDAADAYNAIGKALARGDIGLAAEVLWATLKLKWVEGTTDLRHLVNDLWIGIQTGFEIGINAVTKTWMDFVVGLKSIWTEFAAWMKTLMADMGEWVVKEAVIRGIHKGNITVEEGAKILADAKEKLGGGSEKIQSEKRAKLIALGKTHDTAMELAEQLHQANLDRIQKEGDARWDDAELALATARADWKDALAEVDTGGGGRAGGDGPGRVKFSDMMANLAALDSKLDGVGTFNAAALDRMGVGTSAADRTAKATEAIERHTKDILRNAETGGATFG